MIIVQTNEAKKRIPEALKAGIVLTVFEAKGLEFDDVLLYDFFKDSPVSVSVGIINVTMCCIREECMCSMSCGMHVVRVAIVT